MRKGVPKRYFCTFGEKAYTSKRVSVIACNNVISKAKLSGTPRDTVYSRGKGAHKQKGEHYRSNNAISKVQCATHLPEETPYYKAMIRCFCLSAKAMHLRRDVCLWHVAEYICHHEAHYIVILYEVLCHCEALPNRGPCGILCTRGEKAYTSKRVSVIAPIMRFQKCSARRWQVKVNPA